MSGPLVWVFADGIGLGSEGEDNPFHTVPTPWLDRLLGGGLTLGRPVDGDRLTVRALDATLDVPGLPQSATGQAALFTGRNAAAHMGRHVTALPGPALRAFVDDGTVFSEAVGLGRRVTFANVYTDSYLADLAAGTRRSSVTTWSMTRAGVRLRAFGDLEGDRAVTWDICRDRFAERAGFELARIEPEEAGRHLGHLATDYDLTLFETFYSDLAGHGRNGFEPAEAVRRLDGLVGGLASAMPMGGTWILTSDHGNLEDISVRGHTRNPVPLVAVGPEAGRFTSCRSLLDVAPAALALLQAG